MKKRFLLIICFSLILVLDGCSLVKILKYKFTEPPLMAPIENSQKQVIRRKIDGQILTNADKSNLFPIAVMVENSADAWPLSGLDKANIVIEAITEASIPRFVAIFASDQEITKVGPVRSARPYYLDWIEPLQPLYFHVGGAPEAIKKIRSGQYKLIDRDQFYHSQYYWRDNKWRYAPHNVYTSSELMTSALADKELTQGLDFATWQYKDDLVLEKRPDQVKDIIIYYSDNNYKVNWQYNREENNYLRYQAGSVQKMTDGAVIKAKNIIVQVNAMSIIDGVGRKKITTLGQGVAWIFRDGQAIKGQWVKPTKEDWLQYLDDQGQAVQFNGGATWIEVIPQEDYLSY